MPTPMATCGSDSGSAQKAASQGRPPKRWRPSAKAAGTASARAMAIEARASWTDSQKLSV